MNTPVVSSGGIIAARDVRKAFGPTPALRGASVAIRAGEILALMGPSGSGKSTLLHCLAGIYVPDQGDVLFDGQLVNAMPEAQRTRLRRTATVALPRLGLDYYSIMGTGLVIAFGIIGVTLPLLRRMTSPSAVRFE